MMVDVVNIISDVLQAFFDAALGAAHAVLPFLALKVDLFEHVFQLLEAFIDGGFDRIIDTVKVISDGAEYGAAFVVASSSLNGKAHCEALEDHPVAFKLATDGFTTIDELVEGVELGIEGELDADAGVDEFDGSFTDVDGVLEGVVFAFAGEDGLQLGALFLEFLNAALEFGYALGDRHEFMVAQVPKLTQY